MFAVTDRAVYRAGQGNNFFDTVLHFKAGEKRAYDLYADQNWTAVATDAGVWASTDNGNRWEKIFKPVRDEYKRCYCVFKQGDTILIGTAQGLFRSDMREGVWFQYGGQLARQAVFDIAATESEILIAAADGIYRERIIIKEGKQESENKDEIPNPETHADALHDPQSVFPVYEKIFNVPEHVFDAGSESDIGTNFDALFSGRFIRAVTVNGTDLFLAAKNGIWLFHLNPERKSESDKSGTKNSMPNWKRLPQSGAPLSDVEDIEIVDFYSTSQGERASDYSYDRFDVGPKPVRHITQFPLEQRAGIPLLATGRGVYMLLNGQWQVLYQGLSTNVIHDIVFSCGKDVIAATDQGLFRLEEKQRASLDYDSAIREFFHEPSVQDLQEMVLVYADIEKRKIDRWKDLARVRAFIPSVSLDFDRDASDLYHWNTGANPDELQKGRELVDWGVSLKWDLADAVWSSDQLSIDSRAKLMVELRDDLLDQATRMYFERRRLQIELSKGSVQEPDIWQTQMRIDELTASLDGMTGGQFSRSMIQEEVGR